MFQVPGGRSRVRMHAAAVLIAVAATPAVARALSAPRLPGSPFPASLQPERITVWNLSAASHDQQLLALSAVGIVAQRVPELATVGAESARALGPTGNATLDAWHLSLLPVELDWTLQHDPAAILRRFSSQFRGYVLCDSPSGSGGPGSDNGSLHIAVSLAGILAYLVVTPSTRSLVEAAGVELGLDARRLSLEDVFTRYSNNFSATLLYNQPHSRLVHTSDFAIYGKAFAMYDYTLTMPLSRRALARLQPISMVLGWADEVEFVTSASRHGHQVLCSDATTNLPVYSNFAPPQLPPAPSPQPCSVTLDSPEKHTIAFMFTDGDSITWDLGNFASPDYDWWGSTSRGGTPITWTFQPVLQELHPHFLNWVLRTKAPMDDIIAGPSGAGYTYLDEYPDPMSRASFANWTASNMARAKLTNMVNQIQVGAFRDGVEWEQLEAKPAPPEAVFVDEEVQLSIRGRAWRLRDSAGGLTQTIVSSRRHCLSKTFGDVTPDTLVEILNRAPTDRRSTTAYSVVGVEVWGYGVKDIVSVVARLNKSRVRVVGIREYVACLKQHALSSDAALLV